MPSDSKNYFGNITIKSLCCQHGELLSLSAVVKYSVTKMLQKASFKPRETLGRVFDVSLEMPSDSQAFSFDFFS